MHNKHCEELLSGPASLREHNAITNGVVRNSCLNESNFFHVIDGMAPDIMHNILGVLEVSLIEILKHFSYCEKVTLHHPHFQSKARVI